MHNIRRPVLMILLVDDVDDSADALPIRQAEIKSCLPGREIRHTTKCFGVDSRVEAVRQ